MIPFWTLIGDFLHDLKVQRTRVFLTTFAITWGTIAIVMMMAFGQGFKERLISSMLNAGNQIIRLYGGETSIKYQGTPEGRSINFTEEDASLLLESIPQIHVATPSYGRWGIRLKNGSRTASTYLEAVYPSFEFLRTMYPKKGGRFLNDPDLQEKRRVIYLGSEVTKELFVEQDPIGKTVELDGIPFTLVGIMQPKLQMGMSNGPDDRRAIIPFTTFESLYPHRYLRMITIQPNNVTDTQRIRNEIYRVLGRKYRFDPSDKNALSMWDFVSNVKEMEKIFTGIQIFLGVIGGLTLLVAGVGVANIMYVVVKERTREIGIKKAVGARSIHIISQFVFEALLIAAIGGLLGMFFSWAIIRIFSLIPVNNQGLAYLGKPQLSQTVLFITIFILGAIGLVAGVFPARRAAKLDPVNSLRYE
jgi:putative ABC transport system permease protein